MKLGKNMKGKIKNPERKKNMKKNNKKSFTKQMMSAGVYIALAAAVVGVSTNAIVSILSDDIENINLPDTDPTQYEIRDINLPEIQLFPEFQEENLDKPVSQNQEGVSANIVEKTDIADNDTKLSKENDSENDKAEEQSLNESDFGYPGFVSPCEGFVTREFSPDTLVYSPTMYDYRVHFGTDIACETATPVKTIAGGKITEIVYDDLLGQSITIESEDNLVICYRNLSTEVPKGIEVGKTVKTGDVIGGVGNTALSESAEEPHVHIEAIRNGEYFDVTELYL